MKRPYEQQEDNSLSSQVQDDSVMEYTTTTQLPPYTMEELEDISYIQELNARINETEEQIARGEILTSEEVHHVFLNSRKCS